MTRTWQLIDFASRFKHYAAARDHQEKLIKAAEKNWLKLRGRNLLPKVIDGIKFTDGDEVMPIVKDETQTAA